MKGLTFRDCFAMPDKKITLQQVLRRQWTISDIGWLIINLMPLLFYIAGAISAIQAFLLYMAETFMIGMYNTIRLLVSSALRAGDGSSFKKGDLIAGIFFAAFFVVHFGLFAYVQFMIFMGVSGTSVGMSMFSNFTAAWQLLGTNGHLFFYINLGLIFLQGGIQFLQEVEWKTKSMLQMMFEPYLRIFVQQFTVLAGAMFLNFGLSGGFLVIFMLVKIFFTSFLDFNKLFAEMKRTSGDRF
ncbi:MAG: DUF6498-containing protein [Bacteroidetes bacterium]|jgi:hypothetical protein|uniref:DUF6498-containing protein n=1 Tax=Phnomibacter sp. TaxID=2836217 RepID=UPI002FDE34EE|nr:DUF6498-containing protein [Bacteroidota bacterium]